jgi:hypothetical protein
MLLVVTVRDQVQGMFEVAFGRQCPPLDDLITVDDFALAMSSNLDIADMVKLSMPDSAIPTTGGLTAAQSAATPSAVTMCHAVLAQLDQVESAHTAATEAVALLQLQREKAVIAVGGVEVRAVKLAPTDVASISLRSGVCHTRHGVIVAYVGLGTNLLVGDVIVSVNGRSVLGASLSDVAGMFQGADGIITVEVTPETSLACAIALRWNSDSHQRCCQHIAATNSWIKKAETRVRDDQRDAVVSALEDHPEYAELESPIPLPPTASDQHSLDERWGEPDGSDTPHKQWLVGQPPENATPAVDTSPASLPDAQARQRYPSYPGDTLSPLPNEHADAPTERQRYPSYPGDTLSPLPGAHEQASGDGSLQWSPSSSPETCDSSDSPRTKAAVDAAFSRSIYSTDFDPNDTMLFGQTLGALSSLLDKPGTDIDVSFTSEDASEAPQYSWQRGPCTRAKMERRRLELLQMHMSESDELMNEWMMLLRARATVEHVDKLRARTAFDAAAAQEMARTTPPTNSAEKRQFLRKFKSIVVGGVSAARRASSIISGSANPIAGINSDDAPALLDDGDAPSRTRSLPLGTEATKARARMRASAARRVILRQRQRQAQAEDGVASPALSESPETAPSVHPVDYSCAAGLSEDPDCAVDSESAPSPDAVRREADRRMKAHVAATKRRLRFDPAAALEKKRQAEADAREMAKRTAEIHRRTALMQRLKRSMDSSNSGPDVWIDEC